MRSQRHGGAQDTRAAATVRRTKAVLLAAGAGTRLRPLTDRMPKCLVPIAGRALLDYWIDALTRVGVRDILINTHAHAGQVREHLARVAARASGVRLHESHEPRLLGSAGTIVANPRFADDADDIILVYADNFSILDLRPVLARHRERAAPFTMLLFRAANPRACGIAELDGEGRIVSFVEKPEHPRSDLANAGVYLLGADAYREVVSLAAFDFGFDVIPRFVGRMLGVAHPGYHLDIGTPESYAKARGEAPALVAAEGQCRDGERRAVFLDRDGTMIEHVHYLRDPAHVRLVDGCGAALRRLRDAGYALVVATNQSAIGKNLLDEPGLTRIHERLFELLEEEEVAVDAVYHCPVASVGKDRSAIEHPDRKPGPGMLLRGARELGLSLERSYMVGDMLSDALAGEHAGCRASVLVAGGAGIAEHERGIAARFPVAASLREAVDWILADASSPSAARQTRDHP